MKLKLSSLGIVFLLLLNAMLFPRYSYAENRGGLFVIGSKQESVSQFGMLYESRFKRDITYFFNISYISKEAVNQEKNVSAYGVGARYYFPQNFRVKTFFGAGLMLTFNDGCDGENIPRDAICSSGEPRNKSEQLTPIFYPEAGVRFSLSEKLALDAQVSYWFGDSDIVSDPEVLMGLSFFMDF